MVILVLIPQMILSSQTFLFIQEERKKKKVITHQTNCTTSNRPGKAWFPTDLCSILVYIFFQCNCPSSLPIYCMISLSLSFAIYLFPHSHAYSSNHSSLSLSLPRPSSAKHVSLAGQYVHIDFPLIRHNKFTEHF